MGNPDLTRVPVNPCLQEWSLEWPTPWSVPCCRGVRRLLGSFVRWGSALRSDDPGVPKTRSALTGISRCRPDRLLSLALPSPDLLRASPVAREQASNPDPRSQRIDPRPVNRRGGYIGSRRVIGQITRLPSDDGGRVGEPLHPAQAAGSPLCSTASTSRVSETLSLSTIALSVAGYRAVVADAEVLPIDLGASR